MIGDLNLNLQPYSQTLGVILTLPRVGSLCLTKLGNVLG